MALEGWRGLGRGAAKEFPAPGVARQSRLAASAGGAAGVPRRDCGFAHRRGSVPAGGDPGRVQPLDQGTHSRILDSRFAFTVDYMGSVSRGQAGPPIYNTNLQC